MQQYTWIYSLALPVDSAQSDALTAAFQAFLSQWQSHGTPVAGTIQLAYDRFVVIQANPHDNRPSGCSIDSLKRSVEQILQQKGHTWVDASQVFYKSHSGEVVSVHFQQLPAKIQSGEIQEATVVFDHSLGQSDDLSRWEMPLKDTWMKRFLPKDTVGI